MTHPHIIEAVIEHETHPTAPIPVTIIGDTDTEKLAPEYSSWQSWTLDPVNVGGAAAIQVLPRNPKRDRAVILIGPGLLGNVAGFVLLGARGKVDNGQGGKLFNGQTVVVEGAPDIWCKSDGTNSLTVTIIDERYE